MTIFYAYPFALARGAGSDREFFRRRSGRQFRIRPAFRCEVVAIAHQAGAEVPQICADEYWLILVHKAGPDTWLRRAFASKKAPAGVATLWSEDQCRRCFESFPTPALLELVERFAPEEGVSS
jgi:hypothetical protein